jgi:hypothetical protein
MREQLREGEYMNSPEVSIVKVADGLGYGEGDISGVDNGPEDLQAADRVIESTDILQPVDVDDETGKMITDDGCGDGRKVGWIRRFIKRFGHVEDYKRSLNRPKVFGGGLVMTAVARIGLGQAEGKSFE